ncbi:MAG: alpha/beta hydrolase [Candidatus Cyclonatronum sp.]|uniref:alpha/beta fold hydrolase n=1 Tax=Cyclonatronum sp. TaxID=3024185 RepID=UPI0025C60670|nr:alpha/beta hydrolase [Cyclonatronum sp.]MCH8485305.1 alpha/beta hydrolase [Cyclonatronum sp.]
MTTSSRPATGEHLISIGRQQVRIRVFGETGGKAILFLHGWGCSADTMSGLASSLGPGFYVVLPDFPGFGKTPPPTQAWDVSDYGTFVMQLKEKVFGNDIIAVLAHSFGARVMLKLLAAPEYAGAFGQILLTGGAGMKPKRSWRYYYRTALAKVLKTPFQLLPAALREQGLSRLRKTAVWRSLGSSEYSQLSGVMREIFVKTVREYLEPCLPEIEHEVLLVWGLNDDATPLYQAERMEKGLKKGVLIKIESAGHYAFLDKPQQFAAIAKAYFESK